MQRGGASIARVPGIAEQQTAAAPREHECGTEASWTAANDDDVEHRWLNCKRAATRLARVGRLER
jgi:hypothetical protein